MEMEKILPCQILLLTLLCPQHLGTSYKLLCALSDSIYHNCSAHASVHPFKMIFSAHLAQFLPQAEHPLGSCRMPQYLNLSWGIPLFLFTLCVMVLLCSFLYIIKFFRFFGLLGTQNNVFCALCISNLFAQQSTWSLVTPLVFCCSKLPHYFSHHLLISYTFYELLFEPSVFFLCNCTHWV